MATRWFACNVTLDACPLCCDSSKPAWSWSRVDKSIMELLRVCLLVCHDRGLYSLILCPPLHACVAVLCVLQATGQAAARKGAANCVHPPLPRPRCSHHLLCVTPTSPPTHPPSCGSNCSLNVHRLPRISSGANSPSLSLLAPASTGASNCAAYLSFALSHSHSHDIPSLQPAPSLQLHQQLHCDSKLVIVL